MPYMMATTAKHKLGDISRDEPALCYIGKEHGDNFIGNWVEGFGFIEVRFPKATTRLLTEDEKEQYRGKYVQIGSGPPIELNIDAD